MDWLTKVAAHHEDWIRIVKSFGAENPEDLVQDMYISLYEMSTKEYSTEDKRVNQDYAHLPIEERLLDKEGNVNKSFFWCTLRTEFNKQIADKKKLPLTRIGEGFLIAYNEDNEKQQASLRLGDKLDDIINNFHWYDEMLFKLYMSDKSTPHNRSGKGLSMRDLAEQTGISLTSIHNTITNCKQRIEEELTEDLQDFNNKDYERI